MDIFGYIRRFTRIIVLFLLALVILKALFICTALDIILIIGLFLILLAIITGPC